jgi:hypothetical protein
MCPGSDAEVGEAWVRGCEGARVRRCRKVERKGTEAGGELRRGVVEVFKGGRERERRRAIPRLE